MDKVSQTVPEPYAVTDKARQQLAACYRFLLNQAARRRARARGDGSDEQEAPVTRYAPLPDHTSSR